MRLPEVLAGGGGGCVDRVGKDPLFLRAFLLGRSSLHISPFRAHDIVGRSVCDGWMDAGGSDKTPSLAVRESRNLRCSRMCAFNLNTIIRLDNDDSSTTNAIQAREADAVRKSELTDV